MAITAAQVKELRDITGAGMMACKKALTETNGNIEEAIDVLKKSGAAKAENKQSRIAAEGISRVASDGTKAVVVEVNSETDFVAKNEIFQTFVQSVADKALASDIERAVDGDDVVNMLGMKADLDDKILTIGEKLSIRRFEKVQGDCVASYLHNGGKIGVLIAADGASDDKTKEALTNVAMQIAAMNPTHISREDMSEADLKKLREIVVESALNDPASLPKPILNKLINTAISEKKWSDEDIALFEEKKSNMNYVWNFLSDAAPAALTELAQADKEAIFADKIFLGLAEGRISKQLKETCLLDQVYVKAEDGKQTVGAYLKAVNPAIKLTKMVRFMVGEGIEKRQDNFAEEVAAQQAAAAAKKA